MRVRYAFAPRTGPVAAAISLGIARIPTRRATAPMPAAHTIQRLFAAPAGGEGGGGSIGPPKAPAPGGGATGAGHDAVGPSVRWSSTAATTSLRRDDTRSSSCIGGRSGRIEPDGKGLFPLVGIVPSPDTGRAPAVGSFTGREPD